MLLILHDQTCMEFSLWTPAQRIDSALRIRVLDQSPKTMDDVLNIVSRMEAYSGIINHQQPL